MFPAHKSPSIIIDALASLSRVPSFYDVDYPCFPLLQMLIETGQIDTLFERQCIITGSYSWGLGTPSLDHILEGNGGCEEVSLSEVEMEEDEVESLVPCLDAE